MKRPRPWIRSAKLKALALEQQILIVDIEAEGAAVGERTEGQTKHTAPCKAVLKTSHSWTSHASTRCLLTLAQHSFVWSNAAGNMGCCLDIRLR